GEERRGEERRREGKRRGGRGEERRGEERRREERRRSLASELFLSVWIIPKPGIPHFMHGMMERERERKRGREGERERERERERMFNAVCSNAKNLQIPKQQLGDIIHTL